MLVKYTLSKTNTKHFKIPLPFLLLCACFHYMNNIIVPSTPEETLVNNAFKNHVAISFSIYAG